MFGFLKNIFKSSQNVSLAEIIERGAVIIDVRTDTEYRQGHLKKSINIPLNQLAGKIKMLNKNKPVITCCASGMRSATAQRILRDHGFGEVYNGGSWSSLRKFDQKPSKE